MPFEVTRAKRVTEGGDLVAIVIGVAWKDEDGEAYHEWRLTAGDFRKWPPSRESVRNAVKKRLKHPDEKDPSVTVAQAMKRAAATVCRSEPDETLLHKEIADPEA